MSLTNEKKKKKKKSLYELKMEFSLGQLTINLGVQIIIVVELI